MELEQYLGSIIFPEEIMAHMRCEYIDIEEVVEMYNLDVEEAI